MGAEPLPVATFPMNRQRLQEFSQVVIKLSTDQANYELIGTDLKCDEEISIVLGLCEHSLLRIIEQALLKCSCDLMNLDLDVHHDASTGIWFDCSTEPLNTNETSCNNHNAQSIKICVDIISKSQSKTVSELTVEDKFERARLLKDLGTKLFKDGHITLAFSKYSRALKYLILVEKCLKEELPNKFDGFQELKMQCYLNMAACQGTKQTWNHVISNCSQALLIDSNNVKALFRRAKAYEKQKDYELAVKDLEKASELEPMNNAVNKYLTKIRHIVKNEQTALAKGLSKMFT